MTSRTASPRNITGWHVAAVFICFFGVIVVVNMTMAMIATGSWSGLVVENSYVASQEFNGKLAEARRQAERGWVADLDYDDDHIVLELTGNGGRPIKLDHLTASVGRPATVAMDRTVVLRERSPGVYAGELSLDSGVWLVRLSGASGADNYHLETRIVFDAWSGGKSE